MQFTVFVAITAAIAIITWWQCRKVPRNRDDNTEYFLAGRGLAWYFIAGSITLTNLSTDQLVGMNGNQMLLLAWWELAAVVGLVILALVFLPIYYRYDCTTTTELLERRYKNKHIRATIATLFLLGNVFIYLPIMLYTGSLFMQSMFDADIPLLVIAVGLAAIGGAYAIFGGLRAVAVSDTYSGIGLLTMSLLLVFLALNAIEFDFSGIPPERLTLIGDSDSPIPWHTLLTGMIFIQIFYWSTNQTITQRAMAAPNVREAQKGVFVAALIRLFIVPAIIVIPGICAYKLYGDIGDSAYGRLAGDLLPPWMSGAFAAMMAAAVLTSFNSVLNSSATLYVCDLHEKYINDRPNLHRLSTTISIGFVLVAIALVPVYSGADSIINLVQQLNGLLSMPILSAFLTGLVFRNVDARAVIISVILGTGLYAFFTFLWTPLHYIHLMLITLCFCVATALLLNRFLFGQKAALSFAQDDPIDSVAETAA
jgi:SSS family solute:Na+ symporter